MNPRVLVSAAVVCGRSRVPLHSFGELLGCNAARLGAPRCWRFGLRVASLPVVSNPLSAVPRETNSW